VKAVPIVTTKSLLKLSVLFALVFLAIFRLDLPSLPVGVIWCGPDLPIGWPRHALVDPRLANWVVPLLTLTLVMPETRAPIEGVIEGVKSGSRFSRGGRGGRIRCAP
jgi:hypothetical protein